MITTEALRLRLIRVIHKRVNKNETLQIFVIRCGSKLSNLHFRTLLTYYPGEWYKASVVIEFFICFRCCDFLLSINHWWGIWFVWVWFDQILSVSDCFWLLDSLLDFSASGIIPNVLLDAAGAPITTSNLNSPERIFGKSLSNDFLNIWVIYCVVMKVFLMNQMNLSQAYYKLELCDAFGNVNKTNRWTNCISSTM